VLLAQGAGWTDLDGPLLLSEDRPNPLRYDQEGVHPPDANLWG
jgi:L-Ala-D/L-Glu epimerase